MGAREILNRLGVPQVGRRSFQVADGRTIERDTARAMLRLNGTQAVVTVVVAEPGDTGLLCATSRESLGFPADPISQRLIPETLRAM